MVIFLNQFYSSLFFNSKMLLQSYSSFEIANFEHDQIQPEKLFLFFQIGYPFPAQLAIEISNKLFVINTNA